MANDITTNPRLWSIDTAGALKAAGDKVFLRHIRWLPNAGGDDLILQEYDASGTAKAIVHLVAKATITTEDVVERSFAPPLECNGLAVGTIDGGTAVLEIDKVVPKLTA